MCSSFFSWFLFRSCSRVEIEASLLDVRTGTGEDMACGRWCFEQVRIGCLRLWFPRLDGHTVKLIALILYISRPISQGEDYLCYFRSPEMIQRRFGFPFPFIRYLSLRTEPNLEELGRFRSLAPGRRCSSSLRIIEGYWSTERREYDGLRSAAMTPDAAYDGSEVTNERDRHVVRATQIPCRRLKHKIMMTAMISPGFICIHQSSMPLLSFSNSTSPSIARTHREG